jgi:hypothetical protein
MSNRNEFQNYIDDFDRTAYGAGSQKDPAKDRFSAEDVGRMFDARGDVSSSDAAQMVLDYADDARRDGASMGGGTERALDNLRGKLDNDSGPQVEPESEAPSFNEAAEAEFSPQIQGAIERSNSFRDRAISGQTAQDIYGKSLTLAENNTLGIPVGDPVGGVPQQNKAMQAADSETARYFNPDKYKLNLKANIQDNLQRRLNLM